MTQSVPRLEITSSSRGRLLRTTCGSTLLAAAIPQAPVNWLVHRVRPTPTRKMRHNLIVSMQLSLEPSPNHAYFPQILFISVKDEDAGKTLTFACEIQIQTGNGHCQNGQIFNATITAVTPAPSMSPLAAGETRAPVAAPSTSPTASPVDDPTSHGRPSARHSTIVGMCIVLLSSTLAVLQHY
mmetsp:Transcript_9129/g.20597  ORF Transcript_9129/g.20597 Transcript_9129/m.20597 type:complete len:183 (+) Transcript_9129:150-698(+)